MLARTFVYVLVLAAALAFSAAAEAASPSFDQLPGATGCVTSNASLDGCDSTGVTADATNVAVSPDGNFVYETFGKAGAESGIAILSRNQSTGVLSQVGGTGGCLSSSGAGGRCTADADLNRPEAVAMDPTGAYLYVASNGSDSVEAFSRDASTGALTPLPGTSRCIADDTSSLTDCVTSAADNLEGPHALVVTSNTIYVASDGGLTILHRDANGALTQSGCISPTNASCASATGMEGPSSQALAITNTGGHANLYAETNNNGLLLFDRNTSTGALTQLSGANGCILEDISTAPSCTQGHGLDGIAAIVVTPDDANVFTGGVRDLAVFNREAATGNLAQPGGSAACITSATSGGDAVCDKTLPPFFQMSALVSSPDGNTLYAGDANDQKILALTRAGSSLTPGTCYVDGAARDTCSSARALAPAGLALSPSGANIYAATRGNPDTGAVDVFGLRFVVAGDASPGGAGSVSASSASPGAVCSGNGCAVFPGGAVTLQATPAAAHQFSGWSGACAAAGSVCTLSDVQTSQLTTANFTVDTSPPTINIDTPVDGAHYNAGQKVLASYSCTDPDGQADIALCAGPVANGNPIDTATAGVHSFTVQAADRAGNAASKTVHYTVDTTPASPPEIAGFPASQGCVPKGLNLRVRVHAAALKQALVFLDGKLVARSKKPIFHVKLSSGRLKPGRHKLLVVRTYRSAAKRRSTFTFAACRGGGRSPKVFTFGIPDRGACTAHPFHIDVTITGAVLKSIVVKLDGKPFGPTGKTHFTLAFDPATLTAGRHVLTIKASDRHGNQSFNRTTFTRC